MPDDLEALRKRIEEGVEAAEEMQRILQEQERGARGEAKKRFRLIKGGLIGAGVWAGVEWLRNGRRLAAALVAGGITIAGATLAEYPGSPGADPPSQTITQPPKAQPTKSPTARPTTALTPRRTSPPRTQVPARITPPSAAPITPGSKPTETKEPAQVHTYPPTESPSLVPTVSLPVTPTIASTLPLDVVTPDSCTLNLLGVRVCLPLG